MYIVVQHKISDPAKFWEIAKAATPNLPEGVKLHCALPSTDGSNAICLWEADTIVEVKNIIESNVGQISTNEYFEVDVENAIGLPAQLNPVPAFGTNAIKYASFFELILKAVKKVW